MLRCTQHVKRVYERCFVALSMTKHRKRLWGAVLLSEAKEQKMLRCTQHDKRMYERCFVALSMTKRG